MRFVCVLAVAFFSCPIFGERYDDTKRGYSIDVPDGWLRMSEEEVSQFTANLRAIGEKSEYIAGFKAAPGEIQPPYMLVQWMPNRIYGIDRQLTEAEIRQNADAVKEGVGFAFAESRFEKQGVDVELSQAAPLFSVDMDRKRVVYAMDATVQGQHICYLALMQFMRDGTLQPLYYVTDLDELADGSPAMRTVMSLEIAADAAWSASVAKSGDSPLSGRAGRVLRGALVGAIIGGLVGAFVWIFKRLG